MSNTGRQYPWISVSGYAVATATGVMRVLGNKHWATDVLAGAAVGFLSAETVWHLYPAFTKLLPGKTAQELLLVPTYCRAAGLAWRWLSTRRPPQASDSAVPASFQERAFYCKRAAGATPNRAAGCIILRAGPVSNNSGTAVSQDLLLPINAF